jgi:hypothetical protein
LLLSICRWLLFLFLLLRLLLVFLGRSLYGICQVL